MKKLLLLFFSFLVYSNGFSQNESYWEKPDYILLSLDSAEKQMKIDQENKRISDSTKAAQKEIWKNRDRKSAIRAEQGGRFYIGTGVFYERIISEKKHIMHAVSIGLGISRGRKAVGVVNLSYHATFGKWILKPLLGISASLWMNPNPSPPTEAEREEYREQFNFASPYFSSPPLTFYLIPIAGFMLKLPHYIDLQLLYTPHISFDYTSMTNSYYEETTISKPFHFIGINMGFRF